VVCVCDADFWKHCFAIITALESFAAKSSGRGRSRIINEVVDVIAQRILLLFFVRLLAQTNKVIDFLKWIIVIIALLLLIHYVL